MKAIDMAAYARIFAKFKTKEYTLGNIRDIPIYTYRGHSGNLTVGHFVNGIQYSNISFKDVAKEFRTRDFFIYTLCGCYKDVLEYVKEHIGEIFDREFFKDLIATNRNALEFKDNCFSYMPLEYIDEEMAYDLIVPVNMVSVKTGPLGGKQYYIHEGHRYLENVYLNSLHWHSGSPIYR